VLYKGALRDLLWFRLLLVKDPVVTYAEPEGYFERAALQAISKWKYTAKVENGNPVPVHGVQQKIVFSMRD